MRWLITSLLIRIYTVCEGFSTCVVLKVLNIHVLYFKYMYWQIKTHFTRQVTVTGPECKYACTLPWPGLLSINKLILPKQWIFNSTVKPQWLEHGWLVCRGYFELVFEFLGNSSDSSRKQIFRDILGFFQLIIKRYVVCPRVIFQQLKKTNI